MADRLLASTRRFHAVHDPEQNQRIVAACIQQRAVHNRTVEHLLEAKQPVQRINAFARRHRPTASPAQTVNRHAGDQLPANAPARHAGAVAGQQGRHPAEEA